MWNVWKCINVTHSFNIKNALKCFTLDNWNKRKCKTEAFLVLIVYASGRLKGEISLRVSKFSL